jgi:hypothetical protein
MRAPGLGAIACGCLLLLAACGDDDDAPVDTIDGGSDPGIDAGDDPPDDPDADTRPDATPLPPPDQTWQEHWFEHDQVLQLVGYNDHVALYFDDDVDRKGTEWLLPFMTELWKYTKATYGEDYGPEGGRLYSIHHQDKYSGGHPSTYFDESHDYRNVSDIGPGGWQDPDDVDVPSHEVAHVVEGASYGVHGSPAFGIWRDSKWAEIYQYDVYLALGMPDHAKRVFDKFTDSVDDFPRPGTRWFRDWFYPIYRDHGESQVMPRFFQLLSQHFPRNGESYARDLNFGEFVHFMSGAANADLADLAEEAFGPSGERDDQLEQARRDFPGVTY